MRVLTRGRANQNSIEQQKSTCKRSVWREHVTQPEHSTRSEEYHV